MRDGPGTLHRGRHRGRRGDRAPRSPRTWPSGRSGGWWFSSARTRWGRGPPRRPAGGVRLQFTTAANVALSRYSMEEIRNFRERTGVEADFEQDGYLFLLNSEEDLRRFSETAVVQRALGAPVEVITPEEAARILPGIVTDDLVGATFLWGGRGGDAGGFGGGVRSRWPVAPARSCGGGAR